MSDELEWVRGERHVPHEGGASRRSTSCTRSALKRSETEHAKWTRTKSNWR
jgi:hypothetical protein